MGLGVFVGTVVAGTFVGISVGAGTDVGVGSACPQPANKNDAKTAIVKILILIELLQIHLQRYVLSSFEQNSC